MWCLYEKVRTHLNGTSNARTKCVLAQTSAQSAFEC